MRYKDIVWLCILSLLLKKNKYGYELAHDLDGMLEISQGEIYTILHKLSEEKYIESVPAVCNGKLRVYYRLSGRGNALRNELCHRWICYRDCMDILLFAHEV